MFFRGQLVTEGLGLGRRLPQGREGKERERGSSIHAGRDRAGCSPSSRASLPPSSREVNALTCPAAAPEGNAGLQSPPSTGEAASSKPKGNQARKASPRESSAERHGAHAPPCPSIQQVKRSKKSSRKGQKRGTGPSPRWPTQVPSQPLAREARGEQRQPAGCSTRAAAPPRVGTYLPEPRSPPQAGRPPRWQPCPKPSHPSARRAHEHLCNAALVGDGGKPQRHSATGTPGGWAPPKPPPDTHSRRALARARPRSPPPCCKRG